MKKLLLIFSLLFAAKSFAQYPLIQGLGNDSTLIRVGQNYKGGIKGGLINMSVADTTAANLLRIKAYPGAQIYTDDGSVWIRNITATGWSLLGGGVSPSGSFWAIGGNLFPVTVPSRNIGTLSPYGGAIGLMTNSVVRAIVPDAGFTLANDTTAAKVFTWNPTSKEWGYANWNNGGGGGANPSPAGYALEFSHSESAGNVWAEDVYPVGVNFKKCFYEFWVKPYDSAEYVISTGYGGSHVALFGFGGGTSGKMMLAGNMYYNGSPIVSLSGQDTIPTNTVHNIAFAYDGAYITTFVDGVPSKRTAYTGFRNCTNSPADVDLFIGGSDHSRFDGIIYKARGFETFNDDIPIGVTTPYFPKLSWQSGNNPYFQWDFTSPSNVFLGGTGLLGKLVTGVRNVGANYNEFGAYAQGDTINFPQIVQSVMYQSAYTGSVPSIPGSAKVFDSFSRHDEVPAWSSIPTLDSTEGGTVGKKKWNLNLSNASYYAGVIHNNAYFSLSNFAYVDAGSANDSIIITKASTLSEQGVSVVARRSSSDTYVILENDATSNTAILYKYISGVPTSLGSFSSTTFTTITLVVNGTLANVYKDGVIQISGADISGTSGNNVGFGANGSGAAFVRITKFEVY